ncbi:type II toxin-antitoxin system PemK/MazF family toxin [[Mycobacterium] kokjensenii]|uniref:Type II toxin-antitoxin system PemK/MazF family toxin n=1 Tax=[Mycobacterium] kokjensenii TaxID=3064287 RepID=A0ABN9MW64_9MYCO|nr:type II toxin-antitoxin system PemK/MazF family toxin [Mycolicibacter sp. MU0083]CAJ1496112.1 type II toxin-antitoxin system PemK/MazF family toxin [Mycolicibacter sp. MU0083]
MASPRKIPWRTVQRFAENLVFNEAPRFIRQLEQTPVVQQRIQRGIEQGIKIGLEVLSGGAPGPTPEIPAGRPVTHRSTPTAHRARRIAYAPDLNGRADPGEIVWTWVAYEDEPDHGKDRPVLVVGRDRSMLLGLMLSSRERHADDTNWVGIGSGTWDDSHRLSWVRLDRVLDVPEESIRREGAILPRPMFDAVAARLRSEYSWS